ncbi:PP2C family protein-serine/threonine phosphatase [Actinoallomurus soli]|uniref:PP2C family protein-serine/threonine phosphatase n=1 Tax=Actinoallomurus soli TaxID=2952535 RepID=UPI00209392CF|nr:PP2C family serine/threonine-protein phosphatase [Actinoallomurus soli]MCO5969885.1 serine/threonine-protein phosphatase [Actinoallomurus soli]
MGAQESCPWCGSEVFAGEAFCEACGRSLAEAPAVGDGRFPAGASSPERGAAPAGACAGCGSTVFSEDGYCERCGLLRPGDRDHVETEAGAAAGVTDRGLRHSRNEDAMALAAVTGGVAAVVCDGVSSSPLPQAASRTAADTGLAALAERLEAGDDPEKATRAALGRAVEAVTALAGSPNDAPACTYVSAYAGPSGVTVGWVGDSRAYWLAGQASRRLTTDDSWAAEMVAHGVLTEAEARVHPNAHAIVAWLGADAGEIEPHVTTFVPEGPGTLLLCSDGLWNYYPEAAALTAVLPDADPLTAARHLVRLALEAGGRDNITVVVIPLTQEHAA